MVLWVKQDAMHPWANFKKYAQQIPHATIELHD